MKSNTKKVKVNSTDIAMTDRLDKTNTLCAVSRVTKNKVFMNMPGKYQGILLISNVSAHLDETESLTDMYDVGDIVPCQIIETTLDAKRMDGVSKALLSADPRLINEYLCVKDLYPGRAIQAAVVSKEEYGYVMDTGISSARAFLNESSVQNHRGASRVLTLGQVITCIVSSVKTDSVELEWPLTFPSLINEPERKICLRGLVPGFRGVFTVEKVCSTGLLGKLFNLNCVVSKNHLLNPFQQPSDYEIGSKMDATVLFVVLDTKTVYLTLDRSIFETGRSSVQMSYGQTFGNAVVTSIDKDIQLKVNECKVICRVKKYFCEDKPKLGSKYWCQVIGFNFLENTIYVSITENPPPRLLSNKNITLSSLKVGDTVQAQVTKKKLRSYEVRINASVTGIIPTHLASDHLVTVLKINDVITCKVVSFGRERSPLLTAKKSLVHSDIPILSSYEDAVPNMVVRGVVNLVTETYIYVKFFNGVDGVIFADELMVHGITDIISNFRMGETLTCRVKIIIPERRKLVLKLDTDDIDHNNSRKLVIGKVYDPCIVMRMYKRDVCVKIGVEELFASCPTAHLSDYLDLACVLKKAIQVGDNLGPVVGIKNLNSNVVTRKKSFLNYFSPLNGDDSYAQYLKPMSVVPGAVKRVLPHGVMLELAGARGVALFSNMAELSPGQQEFIEGTSYACKVLRIVDENCLYLSTNIENSRSAFADPELLQELLVENRKVVQVLQNLAEIRTEHSLAKMHNQVVSMIVTSCNEQNLVGYIDGYPDTITATAPIVKGISPKEGSSLSAFVLNIDFMNNQADVTVDPEFVENFVPGKKCVKPKIGYTTEAKVLSITNNFIAISLLDGSGCLAYIPVKRHLNDHVNCKYNMDVGEKCSVKVVKKGVENCPVVLLNQSRKRDRNLDAFTENKNKKMKIADRCNGQHVPYKEEEEEEVTVDDYENECLNVGDTFDWTETWGDSGKEEMQHEDVDEVEKDVTKNKKRKRKEEDEIIYVKERELADESRLPQTDEEFERLVLSSPDSSLVWLQYVAFHLQNAQVDRARAVCQRALSTIGFREEQERLNVWVALLNLENTYGTEASLKQTIKDAEKNNDTLKINKHIIEILQRDNKTEEAKEVFASLLKRFKQDERVWIEYLTFLMQEKEFEAAREILSRSKTTLTSKQLFDVTSKMAQLEFKLGDRERGRTLLENLLANNPKKTNLWAVYIDLEVKAGDTNAARNLLERAISVKGSTRQMKFLFKKYLDFEKEYGNVESVNHVKRKAEEYINAQ